MASAEYIPMRGGDTTVSIVPPSAAPSEPAPEPPSTAAGTGEAPPSLAQDGGRTLADDKGAPPPLPPKDAAPRPTWRQRMRRQLAGTQPHVLLRVFFFVFLAVIAGLAVAAMVAVTAGLRQSYQDSTSIFVGGAGAFLTETGVGNCYRMLASPDNTTELQIAALDLTNMAVGLVVAPDLLRFGDPSTTPALPSPTRSDNITRVLSDLLVPANITIAAIVVIQTNILFLNETSLSDSSRAAIATILNTQPTIQVLYLELLAYLLLASLDYVDGVQRLQYIFMGIILGVLVAVAVIVFLPLDRRLVRATRALTKKNADLERLSNELQMLMVLSPNGIFRATRSGHITYTNPRFLEITGLTEASRDLWLELVHEEDRAGVEAQWTAALNDPRGSISLEFRMVRSNGAVVWVLSESRQDVVVTPSGEKEVQSIVVSVTDITERKRLEQERVRLLEEAAAVAEQHRREQEIFVDTICHGIRNPLNGILNNVDLLQVSLEKRKARKSAVKRKSHAAAAAAAVAASERVGNERPRTPALPSPVTDAETPALAPAVTADEPDSDDEAADDLEALHAIATCANHQRVITDDVLNFSRLKGNRLKLTVTTFRLRELLDTAVIMFVAEAKAEGIELTVNVDPPDALVPLRADRERIMQILTNLLSNAVKFTRGATPERSVTITARLEPPGPSAHIGDTVQLYLVVTDTGIGISEKDQALLFHRFGQVGEGGSRTYSGGSGLGLSICKLLADLMGGSIVVHSELGKGAEFVATLPCEVTEATSAGADGGSASAAAAAAPETALRGHVRVLVVEDNIINQTVLRRQLESSVVPGAQLTFAVGIADNGQRALDVLESQPFDVVLMDLQMPVMDGIEATRRLRARGARVPIIGLSGNSRQEQVDAAMTAGMNAYVVKPYNRQELVRLICQFAGITGNQPAPPPAPAVATSPTPPPSS